MPATPFTVYILEACVRGHWVPVTATRQSASLQESTATVFLSKSAAAFVRSSVWTHRADLAATDVRVVTRVPRAERKKGP